MPVRSQAALGATVATASGNSGAINSLLSTHTGLSRLTIHLSVAAASGTTPTLDVSVEWSVNGGFTWHAADPADAFTQITTTGDVAKSFEIKGSLYRLVWTIGGTTPSFTFSASEAII